ncbi:glycine-rich domain-containing protein [Serratia fonticola]
MPKNEYLPFGTAANANVLPNAEYQALTARSTGFVAGVAKSKELNTAWRQASVIASVVAQFIADNSGKDVLDNGDTQSLVKNLSAALNTQATGRLINIKSFTASGTYTPTPGTVKVKVKAWGAGGGGAGSPLGASEGAGSGGGGSYAESLINIAGVASIPITIGVGGTNAAGKTSTPGGAGGATSFGSYIACGGGLGGTTNAGGKGGISNMGNLLNVNGQDGQGALTGSSLGGTGGAAHSSFGGLPHFPSDGDTGGFPAGGGAGGTAGSTFSSGKGANGYVYIEEYS